MKDFLLIFRRDEQEIPEQSPEEMQADFKKWMDWIGGIAARNQLVDRGNRLERSGKVVRSSGLVTDGPFVEIKESIGGYIMIRATGLDEAAEIAKGCPVLGYKGNVEIRAIAGI